MLKIIVIGSANTDMVIKTDQLPRPGETKLGGRFHMYPGGKGANQAVAAARLGGNVTLIAKLPKMTSSASKPLKHFRMKTFRPGIYFLTTRCLPVLP